LSKHAALELVEVLRAAGVEIHFDKTQVELTISGPKGLFTDDLKTRMKELRSDIIRLQIFSLERCSCGRNCWTYDPDAFEGIGAFICYHCERKVKRNTEESKGDQDDSSY
jgi:hypothetical protein